MKNLTFLLYFTFSVFLVLAQEPSKPEHQHKVYQNDGNIYIQKQLPLYLKFSTTPDGQNYNLKSDSTSNYADPMYLDTEGRNFIRSQWAVNKETNKTVYPRIEILYEIYADGLVPKSSANFSGAPVFKKDKVYYGKGLKVDISSKDAVSGIENIHYALGGDYMNYDSTLSIDDENEYTLYYYSNDNVGNAEKTKENSFVVDITPPSSKKEILDIVYKENILAPSASYKLTSTDGLSGVNKVYYSLDGGADKTYGNSITLTGLKDGDHTVNYYAIDNVKNTEVKKSFEFYLDKIAPVVNNAIQGDNYKGKYNYVSPRTKIDISASDNKAGINNIYYSIDGGERKPFSSSFNMPDKSGLHTVKYDAIDNVENRSKSSTLTVFVDNKAPETGIEYGSPQFFKEGELFITKDTKITLKARDQHSGVQTTKYAHDSGNMNAYSEFTIPSEGPHTINFISVDNVNNSEQQKQSKCHVDNIPPVIYANFSIEPTGTKSKDGKELNMYPNYTKLYLGATDQKVGTETILYSIDDGPKITYSSPTTLDISESEKFKINKLYTIKIEATDKLGNSSEKVIEFYVGKTSGISSIK